MEIIDELGSYDQEIADEEKKKKLLRILPEVYKTIAMVSNDTKMNFNDVVDAMNAEIERQSNINNPSSQNKSSTANKPQKFFKILGIITQEKVEDVVTLEEYSIFSWAAEEETKLRMRTIVNVITERKRAI